MQYLAAKNNADVLKAGDVQQVKKNRGIKDKAGEQTGGTN